MHENPRSKLFVFQPVLDVTLSEKTQNTENNWTQKVVLVVQVKPTVKRVRKQTTKFLHNVKSMCYSLDS